MTSQKGVGSVLFAIGPSPEFTEDSEMTEREDNTTDREAGVDPFVELLAPVPLNLLRDAYKSFGAGEFALGSMAWEVFRHLDELRLDRPVRVWIYASHHEDQPVPVSATWTARYLRTVEAVYGGAHPESGTYRSPLARPEDGLSYWAVYWHVDQLRELPSEERRPVAKMQGLDKRLPYGHRFEPHGPILIEPVGP